MAGNSRKGSLRHPVYETRPAGFQPRPATVALGVSLVLGVLIFGVAINYGLGIMRGSSLRSNVLSLGNGGQQIAAAQGLYRADSGGAGAGAGEIDRLVPTYMSQAPGHPNVTKGGWELLTSEVAYILLGQSSDAGVAEICQEASRQAGQPATEPGRIDKDGLGGLQGAFGCARDDEGRTYFTYRLN